MPARYFLLFIALLPAFVAAQEAPNREATRVTLDVNAMLRTDLDSPVHPLLARLDEESDLATLDLGVSPQTFVELRAQFVFPSVAAYTTWRSSPRTVALFESLREVPDGFRSSLSVRRVRLASFVRDPD